MARGKGSSGGRGRNPSKPNKKPKKQPDKKPDKKKPDNKPKKSDQSGKGGAGSGKQGGGSGKQHGGGSGKQHGGGSGSKVDVGKIIDTIGSILDRLEGRQSGGAAPKTPEPSGDTAPKPSRTSQSELESYVEMLEKELASENPDKEFRAGLLRKIKAGIASRGGDAGDLSPRLDNALKKLEAQK